MLISPGFLDFTLPYTEVQLFQIDISWLSLPDFGQSYPTILILKQSGGYSTSIWENPFFLLVTPNIFFINYIDSWSSHMFLRSFLMLIGSPPYIGRRINYTSLYQLLTTISVDNDCSQRQCCDGRLTIIIINYHYWILLAIRVSCTPLLSI